MQFLEGQNNFQNKSVQRLYMFTVHTCATVVHYFCILVNKVNYLCIVKFLLYMFNTGTLFHVKHRSRETDDDEDLLMHFIDVSNEGAGNFSD